MHHDAQGGHILAEILGELRQEIDTLECLLRNVQDEAVYTLSFQDIRRLGF